MGGPRLTDEERARRAALKKPTDTAVRPQVQSMTGHASEAEMEASLSENTMTSEPEAPKVRKPRTSKAAPPADIDPLMSDPVYAKHVERIRGGSISTTVKGGFKTAEIATADPAWQLEREEISDIDGFSYVCSKRFPAIDPTRHWIGMLLYFVTMVGTMIFKRAAKTSVESWIKKIGSWFGEEEERDKKEGEEHVATASRL